MFDDIQWYFPLHPTYNLDNPGYLHGYASCGVANSGEQMLSVKGPVLKLGSFIALVRKCCESKS